MGQPAEKLPQATYADLEAVPPHKVAEIINGMLYAHAAARTEARERVLGMKDARCKDRLVLRGAAGDQSLEGDTLAKWTADQAERGRPIKAVVLSACSSAAPAETQGTSGMAQWLLRRGKVHAAMGYRSPVGVTWALGFGERFFAAVGDDTALEEAFAAVRWGQADSEPQWVLPLFFARRWDATAPLAGASGSKAASHMQRRASRRRSLRCSLGAHEATSRREPTSSGSSRAGSGHRGARSSDPSRAKAASARRSSPPMSLTGATSRASPSSGSSSRTATCAARCSR